MATAFILGSFGLLAALLVFALWPRQPKPRSDKQPPPVPCYWEEVGH